MLEFEYSRLNYCYDIEYRFGIYNSLTGLLLIKFVCIVGKQIVKADDR